MWRNRVTRLLPSLRKVVHHASPRLWLPNLPLRRLDAIPALLKEPIALVISIQWLQSHLVAKCTLSMLSFFITKWHPRYEQPSTSGHILYLVSKKRFENLAVGSMRLCLNIQWTDWHAAQTSRELQLSEWFLWLVGFSEFSIQYVDSSNKTICCTRDGISCLDGNHKWSLLRA